MGPEESRDVLVIIKVRLKLRYSTRHMEHKALMDCLRRHQRVVFVSMGGLEAVKRRCVRKRGYQCQDARLGAAVRAICVGGCTKYPRMVSYHM